MGGEFERLRDSGECVGRGDVLTKRRPPDLQLQVLNIIETISDHPEEDIRMGLESLDHVGPAQPDPIFVSSENLGHPLDGRYPVAFFRLIPFRRVLDCQLCCKLISHVRCFPVTVFERSERLFDCRNLFVVKFVVDPDGIDHILQADQTK